MFNLFLSAGGRIQQYYPVLLHKWLKHKSTAGPASTAVSQEAQKILQKERAFCNTEIFPERQFQRQLISACVLIALLSGVPELLAPVY